MSEPSWPAREPRQGPNVLLVLLDDVGFGQFGCYGASIATPTIDALAAAGLRFTNFHVPALCSPTRASLLTGRNHHSVGMGFLAAFDTGFPSYRGHVSPAAATIPEMLHGRHYGSYAVGKWHLTPPGQLSTAGPFDQWPTQRGFDRYYGFLWGEDDQWHPELFYDQHRVDTPDRPGYHVSEDLAARAQEFLADHLTSRPDDPFFCYLAFGACHAPHQAPRDYIDRYRGAFDHGWDRERELVLQRQIDLGVVPAGTRLPPADPGVPAWSDLSEDERRLYARMQEVFAGFMEHTDAQVGAVVDVLRARGVLDDTLVIVMSDNGASGEGGAHGTVNEYRYFLGLDDSVADGLAAIDELGGPRTHNQYPAGWAQAGNTPSRYYKRFTHGGGVRVPLVAHWPGHLDTSQPIRTKFHHAIDLAPTILELTGTTAPRTHRGVAQLPLHGTSMLPALTDAKATTEPRCQYFETAGHRGIYADGWKAVTAHRPGTPFDEDRWELYHLEEDFSEAVDLAGTEPERTRELADLWWREAERYAVLPLDDRMGERVLALDPATDRRRYTLLPGTRLLNHVVGPRFSERAFRITATARCSPSDEGVLLAYGRRAFGFSFFVKDGRLMLDYNLAGRHTVLTATEVLPTGPALLRLDIEPAGPGAHAVLSIDGRPVGRRTVPRLVPAGIACVSVQCGHNAPSPVSDEYEAPFTFTGALDNVVVELGPPVHEQADVDERAQLTWQ
ncbi:arylsulfatase [Jiangella asiatica]|uniref:Arylsulfatase n=1 Tax=Jiangella asiatica TaxID=2530372 RepID=A0A4R5DV72_9ACTN|nr:arylsulfatase [Jiangella asiatica]TDE14913.1 arylsulfatase [Jiangella asiatica]